MNKNLLIVAVALLAVTILATPLVGTAMAGKGQDKLGFILHFSNPLPLDYGEGSHAGPVKSVGQEYPIQRTFHGRNMVHNVVAGTLTIGSYPLIGLDEDFTFSSEGVFDFNWKSMTAIVRLRETITFNNIDGTIELSVVDRLDYITLNSEGTIVGHGTGALKGVKIVGTTSGYMSGMMEVSPGVWSPVLTFDRVGTIMGWPGLAP